MCLQLRRMHQMDLSQRISSPPILLTPHLRSRRASKKNLIQAKAKLMRRLRSMDTRDSIASNLLLRLTVYATSQSLRIRNATLTSVSYRQRSHFASSPRQNPSLVRKRKESISKHGLNPLSKSANEKFLSDLTIPMFNGYLSVTSRSLL